MCKRKFATEKSLHKHERLKHIDAKLYICDECGSKLGQPYSLKEHYQKVHLKDVSMDFVHGQGRPETQQEQAKREKRLVKKKNKEMPKLKCPECGIVCTGRSNLTRHKRNRHSVTSSTVSSFCFVLPHRNRKRSYAGQ